MNKSLKTMIYAVLTMIVNQAAFAQAAPQPITFQFTFCSHLSPVAAQARGYITFDENLMTNPFVGGIGLPSAQVLDLSVTITQAVSGNGTFTLNDFDAVAWDSNGGIMDFSKELVGQPTSAKPWGTTPSSGEAGDFNLFGITPGSPIGVWYFTLNSDAFSGQSMTLRSMLQGPASNGTASCEAVPIPTTGIWAKVLMFVLLTGLAGFSLRKKIKPVNT